jgi:hypothetical protein
MIVTYKKIVDTVQQACNDHLAIKSFAEGSISYLDAHAVNIVYPFVFLRPLSSPGLIGNVRTLNFELYSLDVPKLSNESPVDLKSRTELMLYDVLSYLRYGPTAEYTMDFNLSSITPVDEGFQDRAFGWVGGVSVTSEGIYNYCNYPS